LVEKEPKLINQKSGFKTSAWNKTVIFPNQIRHLWRYRELAIELFWTYLKLRYVGSVLGFIWTMLNPALYIFTYWIVFSQIIKMGLPDYPLFLIPGFLAWNFTFGSIISASESILNSQHLITKIAFPIEIPTLVSVAVTLFDFVIGLALYLLAIIILPPRMPLTALALPIVIITQIFFTIGVAQIVACSSVFFRDIPKLIPVLGTMIFFLTPIFYPISFVPKSLQPVLKLNPMTQIVTLYHKLLYEGIWPDPLTFSVAFLASLLFLILGYYIFDRNRHALAELS
jgi:lipopolysaccharide transport system permease protein